MEPITIRTSCLRGYAEVIKRYITDVIQFYAGPAIGIVRSKRQRYAIAIKGEGVGDCSIDFVIEDDLPGIWPR